MRSGVISDHRRNAKREHRREPKAWLRVFPSRSKVPEVIALRANSDGLNMVLAVRNDCWLREGRPLVTS